MKKIDISTKTYPNTFALVDDDDFERINKYKWYPRKSGNTLYAQRYKAIKGFPKLRFDMHREIMRYVGGKVTDHINHDGLDNQKSNLRIVTQSENMMNRTPRKNVTSKYKGVYYRKDNNNWRSEIEVNKKRYSVGSFDNEEDAAKAYNRAAIKHHGEFAYLNKVTV